LPCAEKRQRPSTHTTVLHTRAHARTHARTTATTQSQLRTQLLQQLRHIAGPDAVKGPALAHTTVALPPLTPAPLLAGLTPAAAAAGGLQGKRADQGGTSVGNALALSPALPSFAAPHPGGAHGGVASSSGGGGGMWHAAMRCLVSEYLESCGCHFTLSVFRCVCGVSARAVGWWGVASADASSS
jgi:hypothetical protein